MRTSVSVIRHRLFKHSSAAFLLGAAALVISPGLVEAQDPRLTSLLDTRGGEIAPAWDNWPDSQISLRPVINDNGMVAFSANYPDGDYGDWWQVSMQTSAPGVVTQMNNTTYGSWPLWSQWSYAIDNSNNFLWMNDDTGDRLLAVSNPSFSGVPVFYHATGGEYISGRSLGMNHHGFLAYRADGGIRIYDSVNDQLRSISPPSGALRFLGATSINDQRQVAFSTSDGGLYVYDWDSEATLTLTPSNGVTATGADIQSSINNQGLVAFYGQDSSANLGLYTMESGDPTGEAQLIAALAGGAYFSISMNDQGMILFADTEFPAEGGYIDHLLVWTGLEVITILSTGDMFNGAIVDAFDYSSYAINELGEVVFGYTLSDGTQGVGYILVPEPALAVLALASALLGYRLWRRQLRSQGRIQAC